jgi:hypothetical protein
MLISERLISSLQCSLVVLARILRNTDAVFFLKDVSFNDTIQSLLVVFMGA